MISIFLFDPGAYRRPAGFDIFYLEEGGRQVELVGGFLISADIDLTPAVCQAVVNAGRKDDADGFVCLYVSHLPGFPFILCVKKEEKICSFR